MESFYMITASNASTDLYTENSLVNFKNELPQTINVEGFKIALQSLYLDNKYGNIPNSVLNVTNHFVLYFKEGENQKFKPRPAICNITEFFMTIEMFVKLLREKLGGAQKEVCFVVSAVNRNKRLGIILRNSTLLIHPVVNKWLNFVDENDPNTKRNFFKSIPYIRLDSSVTRTYFSHKDFPEKTIRPPTIIKVQLQEMCQNLSAIKLVQDLAVIKVNPQQYPIELVCQRKEYFDFNCTQLSSLSARLVDENNDPILLGNGQPTFIKLQCKKFPMKSFVLRLSSLESNTIFESNIANNFKIQLQEPIDCSRWDVALASIFLPTKVKLENLLTPANFFMEITNSQGVTKHLTLHNLEELSTQGFIRHVNERVASAFPSLEPVLMLYEEDGKNNISLKANEKLQLKVSGLLAYLINYTATATHPTEVHSVNVQVKQVIEWGMLDFKRLHPHVVFLYCNFITPLVVGHTFGQVLQMIPYYNSDSDGTEVMKYEAQHLDFVPMAMNDPSTLHFEMIDCSGNHIQFARQDQEVLLTLVFREKK